MNAVRGLTDLITVHGLINLDFADVRTVMNESGVAMMGSGVGSGVTGALDAASAAISSPLLEDLSIDGARGVLINITGSDDMTLFEVNEASMLIQEAAHEDANIIFGAVVDETMPEGEVRVTVIATGLDDEHVRRGFFEAAATPVPDDARNIASLRPEAPDVPEPLSAAKAQTPLDPPIFGSDDMGSEQFASPFEDELDEPAFLRRRHKDSDDEDRETPAFLRRAQD